MPFLIAALALAGADFFAPATADESEANIVGELAVYCAGHGAIVALLRSAGSQQKTGDGATSDGARIELYENDSGLWSIVMTLPGKAVCILATGDSWSGRPALPASPTPGLKPRDS